MDRRDFLKSIVAALAAGGAKLGLMPRAGKVIFPSPSEPGNCLIGGCRLPAGEDPVVTDAAGNIYQHIYMEYLEGGFTDHVWYALDAKPATTPIATGLDDSPQVVVEPAT